MIRDGGVPSPRAVVINSQLPSPCKQPNKPAQRHSPLHQLKSQAKQAFIGRIHGSATARAGQEAVPTFLLAAEDKNSKLMSLEGIEAMKEETQELFGEKDEDTGLEVDKLQGILLNI